VRAALKAFGQLNIYLVVGGVAILMILPFYWMLMTDRKSTRLNSSH
jgi:ABC-type glycerol-3-phosphate transport system permease component